MIFSMTKRPLLIAGSIVAAIVAAYFIVPRIPGTLRMQGGGKAWGTGTRTYYYKCPPKPIQLIEYYHAGTFTRSEWFDLQGNLVWSVDWKDGDGWGVYMRQDGTIRIKVLYDNGVNDNSPESKIYLDPSGNEVSKERYDEGEKDNWGRGLDPYEFRLSNPTPQPDTPDPAAEQTSDSVENMEPK